MLLICQNSQDIHSARAAGSVGSNTPNFSATVRTFAIGTGTIEGTPTSQLNTIGLPSDTLCFIPPYLTRVDTSICRGDSINLLAREGIFYAWSPNENISVLLNPLE